MFIYFIPEADSSRVLMYHLKEKKIIILTFDISVWISYTIFMALPIYTIPTAENLYLTDKTKNYLNRRGYRILSAKLFSLGQLATSVQGLAQSGTLNPH